MKEKPNREKTRSRRKRGYAWGDVAPWWTSRNNWNFDRLDLHLCPRPPSPLASSSPGSTTLLSRWAWCPGSRRFSETLNQKSKRSKTHLDDLGALWRLNISTLAGNVTDEIPSFDEIRFLALQFDHTLVRPLFEAIILVETLLWLLVSNTNVVNRARGH